MHPSPVINPGPGKRKKKAELENLREKPNEQHTGV